MDDLTINQVETITGETIGYRRVSSEGQSLDRQLVGENITKIFEDKLSGKDRNRPGLEQCIEYLRQGDLLFVHSIDRLARDLRDLQDIIEKVLDKGASVFFRKENLRFSADKSDPISRLLLHLVGAVAEFERSLIKERQKEGIRAARKRGVKFGRKTNLTDGMKETFSRMLNEQYSKAEMARELGVSRQSIYNYFKSEEIEKKSVYSFAKSEKE